VRCYLFHYSENNLKHHT